jgi:hypothetical protein
MNRNNLCGSTLGSAAVRAMPGAVCGSAHGSVRVVRVAVWGSAALHRSGIISCTGCRRQTTSLTILYPYAVACPLVMQPVAPYYIIYEL